MCQGRGINRLHGSAGGASSGETAVFWPLLCIISRRLFRFGLASQGLQRKVGEIMHSRGQNTAVFTVLMNFRQRRQKPSKFALAGISFSLGIASIRRFHRRMVLSPRENLLPARAKSDGFCLFDENSSKTVEFCPRLARFSAVSETANSRLSPPL